MSDNVKKILIVTQFFYPENFKSSDLAFELRRRGYIVDVLTSIPNYPQGKYYGSYGVFKRRREIINEVNIYRAFQFPRGTSGSNLMLIMSYLSFAICGSLLAIRLFLFKRVKYEAIIVFQTSPITQSIPAIVYGRLSKTRIILWVQDVWPEVGMSNFRNKYLKKLMRLISQFIYDNIHHVLISSRQFDQIIKQYLRKNQKIDYFPNWSDDYSIIKTDNTPSLPVGFNIVMAGNLGRSQNLMSVIQLIVSLKDIESLNWNFVGGGSRVDWLKKQIISLNLKQKVNVLGRFDSIHMSSFFYQADALLLSLSLEKEHLKLTVPSRLQAYMSAGRPILAIAGKGVSEVIEDAKCGISVTEENLESIERFIRDIIGNEIDLKSLRANSRQYYIDNYRLETCIDALENILNDE